MKTLILAMMTLLSFSQTFAAGPTTVSVDEVLAGKRVNVSPLTYKGHQIDSSISADDLCRFLGFARSENYTLAKSTSRDSKVVIAGGSVVLNHRATSAHYSSLICLK